MHSRVESLNHYCRVTSIYLLTFQNKSLSQQISVTFVSRVRAQALLPRGPQQPRGGVAGGLPRPRPRPGPDPGVRRQTLPRPQTQALPGLARLGVTHRLRDRGPGIYFTPGYFLASANIFQYDKYFFLF